MRLVWLSILVLTLAGCGLLLEDAPRPRAAVGVAMDGALDAAPDAVADGALVRMDVGTLDGGPMDSEPGDSAPAEAGAVDTGIVDSGSVVGAPVSFQCVPAVPGNEINSSIGLNDAYWSGFRFEVSAGTDVTTTSMQVNLRSAATGTIFGALVRLTGADDRPDAPNLTGTDVLATTLITVPAGPSSTVRASITQVLSPGWYAAVFGSGAFGASLSGSATAHSNSGLGGCGSGFGNPFVLIQSDGRFALQAATPHFQVDGVRP